MTDKREARDSADSSVSDMPMSLAYCPFPPVMKVYYQWNFAGLTTFHVCGADQQDRLFAVKVHTGYIMNEPLRDRQGLFLYNGPTTKDPLLAAIGDDSILFRSFPVDNNSRIYLPARKSGGLTEEMMRGYITSDKHVAFQFSVEIGSDLKTYRQTFEWRNIHKSERDDTTEHGGFRLFLLPPRLAQTALNEEKSSQSASTSSTSEDGVVAIFEWRRFITSPKHPFDLRLVGKGLSGEFGERWTITVLLTALRLWELHVRGKTQRGSVAVAEKIGSKDKSVLKDNC
ncbi:hypothetical protein F4859DRAFT_458125 [Xylaria cf. heliscus]|nr:hypothetical protein F4859DRAFT_458125 [Xylaria cf. heliscus]